MSSNTKRTAQEAFDESPSRPDSAPKRLRRTKKSKKPVGSEAAPKAQQAQIHGDTKSLLEVSETTKSSQRRLKKRKRHAQHAGQAGAHHPDTEAHADDRDKDDMDIHHVDEEAVHTAVDHDARTKKQKNREKRRRKSQDRKDLAMQDVPVAKLSAEPSELKVNDQEETSKVTKKPRSNSRPRSQRRKREEGDEAGSNEAVVEPPVRALRDGKTDVKQDDADIVQVSAAGDDTRSQKAEKRPRRSRKSQNKRGEEGEDNGGEPHHHTEAAIPDAGDSSKPMKNAREQRQAEVASLMPAGKSTRQQIAANGFGGSEAGANVTGSSPSKESPMKTKKKEKKSSHSKHHEHNKSLVRHDQEKGISDTRAGRVTQHGRSDFLKAKSDWSSSAGQGGLFIDQDPLLTRGGEYLILPTKSDVQIYAASTSLLVRSLSPDDRSSITSCTLSLLNPDHLFIATWAGTLSIWNWTTGVQLIQGKVKPKILQVVPLLAKEKEEELLFLCDDNEARSRSLFKCLVNESDQKIDFKQLLNKQGIHPSIRVVANGQIIVASVGSRILIGYRATKETKDAEEPYTWRELTMHDKVTSFDACVQINDKSKRRMPSLKLVIGLANGAIQLYDDVLFKLVGKEKRTGDVEIAARRLHWHRTAVNTVKWSKDQNYVVSGGNETVLVIWQLDTNQKQFLPHLSTAILNLTISDVGSAYALRLGDNSVMILSTADLLPATNITGFKGCTSTSSSIVMDPRKSDHILVASPSNILPRGRQSEGRRTMLQTFDISSNLNIHKQAITRTLTTTVKASPEGRTINEPDVTHLSVTHNGMWLVTIDEWSPNERNLDGLYLKEDSDARSQVVETTLRFWSSNEATRTWEPVTRINEPHMRGQKAVLDMAVNPAKLEVATLGCDGCIRLWVPKIRVRDGVAVKDQTGQQLMTWVCSQSISMNPTDAEGTEVYEHAALAFSGDGSLLAAAVSGASSSSIHLIDAKSGSTKWVEGGVLSSGRVSLAFADTRLVCLSHTLCIFDVVKTQVIFSTEIDSRFGNKEGDRTLAVSRLGGTFAIGLNTASKHGPGEVLIYDLQHLEKGPAHREVVPRHVSVVLEVPHAVGYVVIDKEARMKQLRPIGSVSKDVSMVRSELKEVARGLDNIFGSAWQIQNSRHESVRQVAEPVVIGSSPAGKRSLDDILRQQSSASAPPVVDLFEKVAAALSASSVAA